MTFSCQRHLLWLVLSSTLDAARVQVVGSRLRTSAHYEGKRSPAQTNTDKQITFIRHGESLGNLLGKKPVKYAIETKGSPTAWRDGRLSESGKKSSINRVLHFEEALVDRILDADVVLVSPLIRALETCIIVLSAAVKRKGGGANVTGKLENMRFQVMSDLREKLSSDSDKPGASSVDVGDFLMETAKHVFDDSTIEEVEHQETMALKLHESYRQEESRTHEFYDDPDDAEKFLASVMRFRTSLAEMPEKKFLIIGHNGWSRWAFAAGLDGVPKSDPHGNLLLHTAFGGRLVQELANVGVFTSTFSQGQFQNPRVYNVEKKTKTKFAVFSSLIEAKDAGHLPRDAVVHHIFAHKKMDSFGYKSRWVTFSATGGHSFLAWSDDMADPKKFIDLTLVKATSTLQYACDAAESAVHVSNTEGNLPSMSPDTLKMSSVRPFHFRIQSAYFSNETSFEFKKLCLLMHIHAKFGQSARFVADIFEEIHWDEGISEPDLDVHLSQSLSEWTKRWANTEQGSMPNLKVKEITDPDELAKLRYDTGAAAGAAAIVRQPVEDLLPNVSAT